jgi:predicted phage replisome organizer
MAEVKWIKITTSMFDDEKIRIIESMPDADSILVVWIKLLTLAGKVNSNGFIFLTENIPYTNEMLSNLFNRPLNTVRLALTTFKQFGMVDYDETNFLHITNWSKHQNIEGLDKIREQNRIRQQRHRETQKALPEVKKSKKSNVTVTLSNAIELDIDKSKKKNIISFEIEQFRSRYSPEQLEIIDRYFEILRTTRVSGKLADSIINGVYKDMNKYDPLIVEYACKAIIRKPDLHSKKENYFAGILRNTTIDEAVNQLNGGHKNSNSKDKTSLIDSIFDDLEAKGNGL